MKVTIQKATAEGCRFITLPDNVLKCVGWKEGDDLMIHPVVQRGETVPDHVVIEKLEKYEDL